jgi:hypothetical protein
LPALFTRLRENSAGLSRSDIIATKLLLAPDTIGLVVKLLEPDAPGAPGIAAEAADDPEGITKAIIVKTIRTTSKDTTVLLGLNKNDKKFNILIFICPLVKGLQGLVGAYQPQHGRGLEHLLFSILPTYLLLPPGNSSLPPPSKQALKAAVEKSFLTCWP